MWKDMTSILSDRKIGDWAIEHFSISENNIRALLDGIPPWNYVKLSYKGQCVMSNTPMEKRTNYNFVSHAHGDILIGGLGIGMIILAIQENENVRSITVLEKNHEVIDLVENQLPLNDKVTIIHADVFIWKPNKPQRFDCIYMDIWNWINQEIYRDQMKPLKLKYGHYLKKSDINPRRFNECWAEWYAKTGRQLY